jgi:hypothetical protein
MNLGNPDMLLQETDGLKRERSVIQGDLYKITAQYFSKPCYRSDQGQGPVRKSDKYCEGKPHPCPATS